MAPRRSKRKRRDSTGKAVEEAEQHQEPPPSPELQEPDGIQGGGQPFTDLEVTWEYERIKLLHRDKKVVMTGYETMAGEINAVLKTLANKSTTKRVTKSALGCYLGLPDYNTRSGSMIHYIVCHQVVPTPNFDETALFFKIGDTIIRFSRVEYALVSGLKFGKASFNPYARHELPQSSIYERLFGENEETTTSDVKTAFINKQFTVKKEKVKASDDDYVKLAKLLIACAFILGFTARKKIPKWLWVLIEDDQAWEDFPWGSISYQILLETVNGVTKLERGSKQITYQFKGNTIAFSAWIFEAVPSFGSIVGRRKTKRARPRFMRYLYVKERGYPTEAQILENVVPLLKPHLKELDKIYWLSLEEEPEGAPFALQYDANESKRKRPRDEEADKEDSEVRGQDGINTTAAPSLKEIEKLLAKYHSKLVDDVANKVVSLILEKAPDAMQAVGDDLQPSTHDDQLAGDDEHPQPPIHDEHGINGAFEEQVGDETVVGASAETAVAQVTEATRETEEPAVVDETGAEVEMAEDGATKAAEVVSAWAIAPEELQPEPTTGAATEATVAHDEAGGQDETFTDTQIDCEFEKLANSEYFTPVQPVRSVTTNVLGLPLLNPRPIKTIYPSKACRSPFLVNDVRPGPKLFEAFLRTENEARNVGLNCPVTKDFFEEILNKNTALSEEHVDAYLAILASNPTFAGIRQTYKKIGLTCCSFMDEVTYVFNDTFYIPRDSKEIQNFNEHDPSIPDCYPSEHVARLIPYADGTLPEWGECVKPWIKYDKIVGVCKFHGNWATLVIDMKNQKLELHDPKAWDFPPQMWDIRRGMFVPMARLIPRLMKEIGYFVKHKIQAPQYAQWELQFGPTTEMEQKVCDSALYCLNKVEKMISRAEIKRSLRDPKDIAAYRHHVATSIYAHSTLASTVDDIISNMN